MMALKRIDLNDSWRFVNDWHDGMLEENYDDSAWREVELPHDWSAEGAFSPDAPSYCRGAYLPTGMGCYRRKFTIPDGCGANCAKLYFGGIYRNSEIFLNGHRIGGREWGYIPFEVVLTPHLKADAENLLVVKVDNSAPMGCRWYAGSGIYRKVELEFFCESLSFPRWGFRILTPEVNASGADVRVEFKIRNNAGKRLECLVRHEVTDRHGRRVAAAEGPHWIGNGLTVQLTETFQLSEPALWSVGTPSLYTLKSSLFLESECVDSAEIRFGVRSLKFDARNGFFLNGEHLKIQGVCLHNDGGALGAACGKTTFLRQLRILKSMGCNAVRTAHHPFGEEFLDACDEMGILVLAEAFDEWSEPIRVAPLSNGEWQSQTAHYYAHIFERCACRDLADMVLRDRNHPSIFMWSVGNEVPQMYKSSGREIAGKLREVVRNLDESRPVTCACAVFGHAVTHDNIALLDVGGYNYPSGRQMDDFHAALPNQPMIVTECFSAQTRRPLGTYCAAGKLAELGDFYPAKLAFIESFEDMKQGREAWEAANERPFIMGQFIWTGWDYLGEPTPYDYPAHSSFFGVIDLCGFPKDGYYYYRSVWCEEPLVHIASHWDFDAGDQVEVRVITNCPVVELFLNGISRGKQTAADGFVWQLEYAPGELRAVAENNGKWIEDTVSTSGKGVRLDLNLSAMPEEGPRDIIYVECRVLDDRDCRALNAELPVRFSVSGAGTLKALDNGSQISCEPFWNTNLRHTCAGRCLCIIRTQKTGEITVRAESPGLTPAELVMS